MHPRVPIHVYVCMYPTDVKYTFHIRDLVFGSQLLRSVRKSGSIKILVKQTCTKIETFKDL